MPNDADLVQRAQSGEAGAFAEIYDLYQPPVYRYIYYRVGDVHAAEDLTADVFLRMVEKIDRFTYRGQPLLAWLYTIARNLVNDYHRLKVQPGPLPLAETALPCAGPEDAAEFHLTQQELAAALTGLTEEQRQVILCKFVECLDNETVAKLLGKPVGAVKSLQHRALAALRRILERGRKESP